METIIEKISKIVSEAFVKSGYNEKFGRVTLSDRPDLCQFQCNGAMMGAREYKKSPLIIANEVVETLKNNEIFETITAVPPGFINIILKDDVIIEKTNEISDNYESLIKKVEGSPKVIIDYGGPNVAKPLHVGHLRSAIIGESVKRLARALGYDAIGDIHLGDWGLQIGLIITEYKEQNPNSVYMDENYSGPYEPLNLKMEYLNEIYPLASKKSKEDEEYRQKAKKATFELQNGRPGYIAFWKEVMKISVADLKQCYDKLDVNFDLWYGESDSQKYIPDMIKGFIDNGYAHESEGALVIDVEKPDDKAPMPPVIVKKTDGSDIYATTDLATILQRMQDYNPKMMIYFTDSRQGLHFEQVFRAARKTGIVNDNVHLEFDGFGTMNGKDGKPYKTRDGGVMHLSDLINTVVLGASEKMKESKTGLELSEEEQKEIASMIGIAALKFGDLINHRSKDYIFDLDKFLSFEGKTGPYLLYTMVRLKAILRKAEESGYKLGKIEKPYSDVEREIMLKILNTSDVFWQAFNDKAPSIVCENAYQIASLANKFYYETKILSEEDNEKRESLLRFCELILKVLQIHMDILAIKVPEVM